MLHRYKKMKAKKMKAKLVKESLNELSHNTLKSAVQKMQYPKTMEHPNKEPQRKRSENLSNTYFREFIGLNLLDTKVITQIVIYNSGGGFKNTDDEATLVVELTYTNKEGEERITSVSYDMHDDRWDVPRSISRKDLSILRKIALKINPNSKYKTGTQNLNIDNY